MTADGLRPTAPASDGDLDKLRSTRPEVELVEGQASRGAPAGAIPDRRTPVRGIGR